MFRGINQLTLDDKGRLAMPARHREQIRLETDGQVVITIDTESPCLLAYPLNEWEKIEKKLIQLPSFHPIARKVQRLLLGHASEASLDGHGRFLIPSALREFAKLQKEVVMIGQGHKFELWDAQLWQTTRDNLLESTLSLEQLPEE